MGDLSYDGPCPPPFLNPVSHTYVFTVYALDTVLPTIPSYGDFQPGSEALYQALIVAGQGGHIVRSADITGFFPQPLLVKTSGLPHCGTPVGRANCWRSSPKSGTNVAPGVSPG